MTRPLDDPLEIELSAFASLSADMRSTATQLRQAADVMFDRHAAWINKEAGAVAVAGTPTLLNIGGPNSGRYWEITGLVVSGSDDRTIIAGTNVAFYVGNSKAGSAADLVLPGSQGGSAVTVPANAQFSRRQLLALYPDQVFCIIYGAGTGQNLLMNLLGWDRDLSELPVRQ